ncbi:unnamed protein product [Cunninghamella blakesleeana]
MDEYVSKDLEEHDRSSSGRCFVETQISPSIVEEIRRSGFEFDIDDLYYIRFIKMNGRTIDQCLKDTYHKFEGNYYIVWDKRTDQDNTFRIAEIINDINDDQEKRIPVEFRAPSCFMFSVIANLSTYNMWFEDYMDNLDDNGILLPWS